MDRKKLWNVLKLILKLLVTGLSLYLVSKNVNFTELRETASRLNPGFVLLALLAFFVSQIISASRLNTFFKGIGLNISAVFNFKIYILGMFYNLFLPGGIGGDGYKIFLLRRKFRIKGRRLFQAIFFDRLSGLWALSTIISAIVIFIPNFGDTISRFLHDNLRMFAALFPEDGISNWLPINIIIVATIIYFIVMRRLFPDYSSNFFLTHTKALMVQSMQVVSVILLLYALDYQGKFSPYLFMFLASSLVAIFPFTVGGLGARELVFILGAKYFNMDEHIAVVVSLLFYCIAALTSLGGVYFVFKPGEIGVSKVDPDEVDEL